MHQVNIHDAKTHFSRLVDDVAEGESVVIAKAGLPVARLVPSASRVATTLFVLIVLTTFWDQRQLLSEQLPRLGPATLVLNLTILGLAYALATQAGLLRRDRIAVVTECGLQNSALGITVCLTWLNSPAMSAPSVVYALLMNVGALVFVLLMRTTQPT